MKGDPVDEMMAMQINQCDFYIPVERQRKIEEEKRRVEEEKRKAEELKILHEVAVEMAYLYFC